MSTTNIGGIIIDNAYLRSCQDAASERRRSLYAYACDNEMISSIHPTSIPVDTPYLIVTRDRRVMPVRPS